VLLKPGGENSSQVVVLGRPVAEVTALSYRPMKAALLEQVLASLADLRSRFDVVVCEGAGSPTEINLRADDIANMGLATAAGLPVVVVGDIDRGGVFAALYGTVALMPPADQRLVAGFLVNKFRGDARLLTPGLDRLAALTGRPTLGVLPWRGGLDLDVEDSLGIGRARSGGPPHGADELRVSVARLPRLSNVTDLDALAAEPGVLVRYATAPEELADADLVVLPGTRATVADLAWLRATGLADAVLRHAAAGGAVLGVCGGHQMLARTITDDVESGAGTVPGLGLLPAEVRFAREKTLARPAGSALGQPVHGYEIHHGQVGYDEAGAEPFLDGGRAGAVFGTTWHGALENDGFRRAFLTEVARIAGRRFVPAPGTSFAAVREARLDALGDLVEQHADTGALWRLVEDGVPPGLPLLPPGAGL
jgi:adenosylcobyric acid synthase